MSRLAALQREFLAAIFDGGEGGDPRLAIHRRSVLGNFHGALAAAYPVVRRLVGEAFFREAARRFACAVPSTRGDLHAYGAPFAAFLVSYPHAASLPYLPDVARLEWALHESALAADGARLDHAALARLAPEAHGRIRLRLHPAARLVRSPHPVLALWEANQPGCDGTPARRDGPDRVLVAREGLASRPQAVDEPDWTLLAALACGATLDEACDALGDEAEAFLAPALAAYAARGIIVSFDMAPGA